MLSTSPRLVSAVVLFLLTSEGELMDSEEVVCAALRADVETHDVIRLP